VPQLPPITLQHKDALLADLQASACLGQSQRAASRLLACYEDRDGFLRDEVALAEGRDTTDSGVPTDVMSSFYRRLGDIREYHRRYPSTPEDAAPVGAADQRPQPYWIHFCPTNSMGAISTLKRHLKSGATCPVSRTLAWQLLLLGTAFAALARSDYIGYLRRFVDAHTGLPTATTHSRRFHRYVVSLTQALLHFSARSQPLLDLRRQFVAYVRAACDASSSPAAAPTPQQSSADASVDAPRERCRPPQLR